MTDNATRTNAAGEGYFKSGVIDIEGRLDSLVLHRQAIEGEIPEPAGLSLIALGLALLAHRAKQAEAAD